jgi:hypothetical protein
VVDATAQQERVGVICVGSLDAAVAVAGAQKARQDKARQGSRGADWWGVGPCDYVSAWRAGRVAWLPAVPCVCASTRCVCAVEGPEQVWGPTTFGARCGGAEKMCRDLVGAGMAGAKRGK